MNSFFCYVPTSSFYLPFLERGKKVKIVKRIDKHLEEFLLVPLFSVMVFVIGAQVFMRKVLNDSLSWSEELARYCFIWLVFIGISYAVKKQRHIRITALFDKLNDKVQIVLSFIVTFVFIVFALIVVYFGYEIADKILSSNQISPSLRIPMGLVYMAAPIGMLLTVIRLLQNAYFEYKTIKKSR